MKRYGLLIVILIAAMLFPTLVGAQSPDTLPGTGWWTGNQIMNVGTSNATIQATAYDSNSAATYTASAGPIAPGSSVTFLPADFIGMGEGFQGSAIVSSNQPIKAIVNLTNRYLTFTGGHYGVQGGAAGGQYQGMDGTAAATTLRFPIAKSDRGAKTTTFFVQNAGTVPNSVQIAYVCENTNTYTQNSPANVGPGQMEIFSPAAAGVPAGQLCSATVTSTGGQPVAGVSAEHWTTEAPATLVQATRAFTPGDYDDIIYAPIFKNTFPGGSGNPGSRTTGAQIQNVSGGTITIRGTFYGAMGTGQACPAGTSWTVDVTGVANGASANFLYPAGVPQGCLASAKFEGLGGGNIVGIINESFLNPIPPQGTQAATAYNLSPASSATDTAAAPLFKEEFGGKNTGLQVQNIGAVAATLHLEFKIGGTTYTTINVVVQPGASQNYYRVSYDPSIWVGTPLPRPGLAGVTVISDQPVLVNASESPWPLCSGQGGGPCYDRQNYEGFNLP